MVYRTAPFSMAFNNP